MSVLTRIMAVLCAVCCLPLAATAGTMPQAKVDFSADSIIESQGMIINSRIYHSLNKDRMEMNASGMNSIVINRMDKKLTWMLMPDQKMYTEVDITEGKKNSKDMSDCSVEYKSLGSDVVNGFRTTKNRINMTCPDNLAYSGNMWVTKDNIVMKMNATATTDNGTVAFKMELKNLKISRQNSKLFEIPAGYEKMSLTGILGGMFSGSSAPRGRTSKKNVGAGDEGRSYTARSRDEGRSYTAQSRDDGRSYTSKPRKSKTRKGRSYTSQSRDEGRSYTAAPRDEGRSYTAASRDDGRSYTSNSRNPLSDPVKKLRSFFGL